MQSGQHGSPMFDTSRSGASNRKWGGRGGEEREGEGREGRTGEGKGKEGRGGEERRGERRGGEGRGDVRDYGAECYCPPNDGTRTPTTHH